MNLLARSATAFLVLSFIGASTADAQINPRRPGGICYECVQ